MASCLLLWGGAAPVEAAPTVTQMLNFRPRQEGVVITTPTAQEEAGCKVELAKGRKGSGWILRDGSGKILRRFYDTNDDNRIDVWSYYKDGVEVYRETDTNFNGKADQYRWLNTGGSKWGVDENEDGKIDSWKMISAEEVSQEVIQAIVKQDFARLQVLMITEADLKAINLPEDHAARVREARKGASAKFAKTIAALTNLNADKTHWLHLETAAPQVIPAEQTGHADVLHYAAGTILVDTASKNDWVQTGEMILVGGAWRLVDAPSIGLGGDEIADGSQKLVTDPEQQKLLDQLRDLDAHAPKGLEGSGANPEVVRHNLMRADLLEKILGKTRAEERDPWVRQLADCLSAAAQSSPATDKAAAIRLAKLEEQMVSAMPGSSLTAYVVYREMSAEYAVKLLSSNPTDLNKAQEAWLEKLAKFVQTYSKSEDAPDALMQLGMVSEFLGKEIEAKKWYAMLTKEYADKPQGPKGAGALKRLELEGKALKLAGPTLSDSAVAYDVDQMRGKLVVVYYWASWNGQSLADFAKLKQILDANAGKVALLCVNLDNTPEEAKAFIQRQSAPGTHLHQPGGLDSKLATDYGINVLPIVFLVGKDGKVVSRSVQIVNLEEEIKKQLK
jgi:thiol-disulfide isomerase/thioredoxin